MPEHHVAIVSFEGAVKREVKRVRDVLARDETLSEFYLTITASGRTSEGDVKLSYKLAACSYTTPVEGDSINAIVDEFLRRRGWSAVHAPKAIGYHTVPGEDTDEQKPAPLPW